MQEGLISINGSIFRPDEAHIPALDRGFLFGDNVFEVLVAFREHLLNPNEHFNRLRKSAGDLGMEIPWSDDDLLFEIQSLVEQLKIEKAYVRLQVTRGSGLGLEIKEQTPNKYIYAFPAKAQPDSVYTKGFRLSSRTLPYTERRAMPKTGNYLRSILAMREAQTAGYDDILWCNSENELTESSTANVFLIGRDGDLVEIATPATKSGILEGITRATVQRLLTEAQIPVTVRTIYREEIPRFDEGFLCSTVRGLVPLVGIDEHQLHTTRTNSIFRHIKRLYATWVQTEIGYRVDWNSGKPEEVD